jgi:hypothetical protein
VPTFDGDGVVFGCALELPGFSLTFVTSCDASDAPVVVFVLSYAVPLPDPSAANSPVPP